jgi:hypothetical protein
MAENKPSMFRQMRKAGPRGEWLTPDEEKQLLMDSELEPIEKGHPRIAGIKLQRRDKEEEERKHKRLFKKARERKNEDEFSVEYIAENN